MIFMSELSVFPRKEENRKEAMVQVIISFCLTRGGGGAVGQGIISGEAKYSLIPLPRSGHCSQRIQTSYCLSAVSAEISLSTKLARGVEGFPV
jgi:hypothetical protein